MKILLLGASGLAGRSIKKSLEKAAYNVIGTYQAESDRYRGDSSMLQYKLEENRLADLLNEVNPDAVISSIRGDYSLQMEAHRTMVNFIKNKKCGKLLFLSTANVFDGAMESAHYESDQTKAQSAYGKFKIQCEDLIQSTLEKNRRVIIRIPAIWGKDCPRLEKLIRDVKEQIPIQTYRNLFVNYTTDQQIAEWISYILEKGLDGVFHIGTKDVYEYAAFQQELAHSLQLGEPVFQIEKEPSPLFQAVLPGRTEIPENLQLSVKDVIRSLSGRQVGPV